MIFKKQVDANLKMMRLAGLFTIFAMVGLGNAQLASAGGPECVDVLVECVSNSACPDPDESEENECDAGSTECPGVLQCGPDDHPNCVQFGYESLWCAVSLPD